VRQEVGPNVKEKPLFLGAGGSKNSQPIKSNRRTFCSTMAAGLALSWSAAKQIARETASPGKPQGPTDEASWSRIRSQFLLEPDFVYFNNASIGLPPRPAIETVNRGYQRLAANPNQGRAELYEEVEREARPRIARLVGADAEEIALTRGASEGLYLVANGIPLERGDEVLTTNQEHPAGLTPWTIRGERFGIVVRQVEIPSPFEKAAQVVQLLERAVSKRTKVISFCHVTRGGWLFPTKEICEMARRHGILSLVDGAQAIGMVSTNLHDLGCDLYATSLHKWMVAPSGNGMLYVRREMNPRLSSLFGLQSQKILKASQHEMPGTLALPVRVAVGSAAAFIEEIGIDNIEARNRFLSTYLRDQLGKIKRVRLLGSPSSPVCSPGITLFEPEGIPATELQATILDQFRINVDEHVRNGHNAIRVSTHFYNTRAEIDRLTRVLHKLIA